MKPRQIFQVTIILILIGYVTVNSAFGIFTVYEYSFWQQKENNADMINSEYHLDKQPSILYLDPGDAPYYFHANASCHYITPMPVERSTPQWDFSYLPQYKEAHDCIMAYEGEYIVADIMRGDKSGFFGAGILASKPIMEKLKNNYTVVVEDKSWTVYKKK